MIDSLWGAVKVNNFLAAPKLITLNTSRKLREGLAAESQRREAQDAYKKEMEDIAKQEVQESQQKLEEAGGIENLGVWLPPDSSPSVRYWSYSRPRYTDIT